MRGLKKLLMVLLVLTLLSAVGAGLAWNYQNYVMVDFRFYPRHERVLDLRGEKVTVAHYEKVRRRLPGREVLWDVPFQGNTYPEETKEITVTALTEADIRVLEYLKKLETVNAEGCTDYVCLLALETQRPELTLNYTVTLGEESYRRDVTKVNVQTMTAEEIPLLQCLPQLETVVCSGGTPETVEALQKYCHEQQLQFSIGLGGKTIAENAKSVSASEVTEQQLSLLRFLPELEEVHLTAPEASVDSLLQLHKDLPDTKVVWEQEICGRLYASDEEEIDLSGAEIGSLEQVEEEMVWFPFAQRVFLGDCGFDNEELAAYRDFVRNQYKVVWTVQLGEKLTARTDDTTFMPVRTYVYYFNDEEAYNLRYCEDMVCIDIGHMSIHNIDFVEFMPNLEFLVLAHTQVQDISPIKHCRKLKFLELDWTPLRDYSPLVECKALEDLNLGNTYGDFDPIGTMTWLKNLWMIGCSRGPAYRMTEALPDTKVMISGAATVANGWRNLDNYYEMRDLLGMHYMSW